MFESIDDIYLLFKKINLSKNIILHVKKVREISLKITDVIIKNNKDINIDKKLVSFGALLHDIGRAKTHDIFHAIEGVKILQKYNCNDKKLLSIVENHIGAGISKEEARILGLPVKDYIPISIEEKIVSASDNLTFGNKRITIKTRVDYLNKKKLFLAAKSVKALHDELSKLAKIDIDLIV